MAAKILVLELCPLKLWDSHTYCGNWVTSQLYQELALYLMLNINISCCLNGHLAITGTG